MATCGVSPDLVAKIQAGLQHVVNFSDHNGGLLGTPNTMWSAIVDGQGVLCSVVSIDPDAWPGSRSIAIAKAATAKQLQQQPARAIHRQPVFVHPTGQYRADDEDLPGRLVLRPQQLQPFNPDLQEQGAGVREVPGGIITFGSGVPLYERGRVIGGLGVSGDSACADHAVAFRMRKLADLDGTPGGRRGATTSSTSARASFPTTWAIPTARRDIMP